MSGTEYVVVIVQIVGNAQEWAMAYYPDDNRFDDRDECIKYGVDKHDHDDFLIAIISDNKVVGTAWQHDDRDEPEECDEIAAAMGLESSPHDPDPTPEQDLRAAVADLLKDIALHFDGCGEMVEGDGTCRCLLGRLERAIAVPTPAQPVSEGAA